MATPSHDSAHAHTDHGIAPYAWVFIALLALLAAAVVVAFVPTENYAFRAALTTLAYGIAFVKALLIVLWFMHLKESTRLTWLFAGTAFFFVAILIFLTLNDYASRGMIRRPFSQPPPTYLTAPAVPAR